MIRLHFASGKASFEKVSAGLSPTPSPSFFAASARFCFLLWVLLSFSSSGFTSSSFFFAESFCSSFATRARLAAICSRRSCKAMSASTSVKHRSCGLKKNRMQVVPILFPQESKLFSSSMVMSVSKSLTCFPSRSVHDCIDSSIVSSKSSQEKASRCINVMRFVFIAAIKALASVLYSPPYTRQIVSIMVSNAAMTSLPL